MSIWGFVLVEMALLVVAMIAAIVGNWGLFAALALLLVHMPIWIIAGGIVVRAMFISKDDLRIKVATTPKVDE